MTVLTHKDGTAAAILAKQMAEKASDIGVQAQRTADRAIEKSEENAEEMAQMVVDFSQDIADLQSQIDGNVTTWFYTYDPIYTGSAATSNYPCSDWITNHTEDEHLGDIFYNTTSGYTWRWVKDGSSYAWLQISDSAVTEALAKAQEAYDIATDHKRRIFFTQPVPPYDEGDLWVQGSAGDIMRATASRTEYEQYTASDWVKASKYTDDTRANEAYTYAGQAWTSANGKNTVYHSAVKPTGGTYKNGDTWFDTAHDYTMYTYSEAQSDWVKEQFGNAAIQDLSIDNAKIQNATIEYGKIKSVDAGTITVGQITAGQLATNNIDVGLFNDDGSYASPTDVDDAEDRASLKADNYITPDNGNSIKVHAVNNPSSNYTRINSDGMQIVKGNNEVASFGDSEIQLGKNSNTSAIKLCNNKYFIYGGSYVGGSGADVYYLGNSSTSSPKGTCITSQSLAQVQALTSDLPTTYNCSWVTANNNGAGITSIGYSGKKVALIALNGPQQIIALGVGTYSGNTATTPVSISISTSGITLTSNTTIGGKLTTGAINAGDLTTIESYDINVGSSGETGAQSNSANKTKSGYYPLCVAGFSVTSGGAYSRGAYLTNRASGSCTINARVYANTAGVKSCTVHVLWMKNTI